MSVSIQRYSGEELEDYIPAIAALRIHVFRAFPYLYAGNQAYESEYLQTYLDSPGAVVVIARDGNQVIGASTGLPLASECEAFQRPFVEAGYALDKVFYCAESVLIDRYRGQGIGVEFFRHRIAHAREYADFDWLTFCAVQRADDHPLKPDDYVPLDSFWQQRGFQPAAGMTTDFSWQDVGQTEESTKAMQFWLRKMPASEEIV